MAPITAEIDELLTVQETAQLLRLAPVSIYRRVESGELRSVKLGAGPKAPVRIPRSALAEHVLARPSTTGESG